MCVCVATRHWRSPPALAPGACVIVNRLRLFTRVASRFSFVCLLFLARFPLSISFGFLLDFFWISFGFLSSRSIFYVAIHKPRPPPPGSVFWIHIDVLMLMEFYIYIYIFFFLPSSSCCCCCCCCCCRFSGLILALVLLQLLGTLETLREESAGWRWE